MFFVYFLVILLHSSITYVPPFGKNLFILYIKFFEKFQNYLSKGGVIITDNLKFHGLVADKDKIESRNVLGLVTKIEKYIEFLRTNEEFVTKFYDIGDGLSVSFRKSDEDVKNID